MTAMPSTYTSGNFILNYTGSRMNSATYKGNDLANQVITFLHDAMTNNNRPPFKTLSYEIFDLIADLDENNSMYELSIALTNYYFEHINGYFNQYLNQGLILQGQEVLMFTIAIVLEWQDTYNYEIHKGTPYMFLGMTHLLTGNLDLAFTIIHDALSQDTYTYPRLDMDYKKEAPAYLFATLNINNPANMLYEFVQQMKQKVDSAITAHNIACGTTISSYAYPTFDKKFLQSAPLENIVFYFVCTLMTILNLEKWDKKSLANNAFSRLKQVDLLFNVSLVVDKTLSEKYQSEYIRDGVLQYLNQVEGVPETKATTLNQAIKYSDGNPFDVNDPIEKVLPALLANDVTYHGRPMSYRMRAMLSAWNVRNFSAHNLTGIDRLLTTTSYDNIFNLLMSALFFATEVMP